MWVTWREYPPERLLREQFHITTGFHAGQYDVIQRLVRGERLLVIQHTGWGKSLCYQMTSLYYPHLTIVFSPLKALMRDQCRRCSEAYAIPSAIVSSDYSEQENRTVLEMAVAGKLKLLYIAPERLSNALWQAYAPRIQISMIVIDEAHCISLWGHDFRPHYRRIVRLLSALPAHTPILALTATANRRVEADILQQMGHGVRVLRGTMMRPNLRLNVVQTGGDMEKLSFLVALLPQYAGSGIIYTATRKYAELVTAFLQRQGIAAVHYHAGQDNAVRREIEQRWMTDQYRLVCSTNALGMGIDKQNVRFIIHYHIPASPTHYYQEIGRAGRDGNVALCVLLSDPADLLIQEHFINDGKPGEECYELVLAMLRKNPQGLQGKDLVRLTGLSSTAIRAILLDLEDQFFIQRSGNGDYVYVATGRAGQANFAGYNRIRFQKLGELSDMQAYTQQSGCYMRYLTTYLGDPPGRRCGVCGHCQPAYFPEVPISERIREAAAQFLARGDVRVTHYT
ncbi:MAG: ATP-dependent DNA helicase RecQ [Ktedonobacteraceae bacterium]|nr:ATP-dependent DNA helicase RecQ [Ktedonobacteraceae bacterium]